MEYFDIRNPDGSPTGELKERSLVHRDGDLHATVHVFIVRKDEQGRQEILLQKRSAGKDAFPGCYDISAAGHVSAGQGYMEAALRELEEELGLKAEEDDLRLIGYHEGYAEEIFYGKPFRNHEISAVYLYEKKIETDKLILQEEEVESVKWMSLKLCKEKAAAGDRKYCLFEKEINMIEDALRGRASS